jgi:hypothetical protein
MASTGLLGFNPYRQGVAIDISSKPVQLAVQLEQKEQAKKGALEKYFMDYEKSVNPAGLSKGESDIFLKKYNDNKQFWMKNKEAILNPSKYGYDAQSQYMANLKDQMGYINEAKQANEQRKAFNSFIAKAKAEGKDISDNVLDITSNAAKPVGAGYIAPDLAQVQVFKPHDPISYLNDLKKVNRIETEPELKREGAYDVFTSKKIPDLNEAIQVANGKLKNDKGYEKYILNLAQDPQELIGLGKIYQQRTGRKFNPQSIEDVSLAYTLSGLPIEQSKSTRNVNPYIQSSLVASRSAARGEYGGFNPYNAIQSMIDNGEKTAKDGYLVDYNKPRVQGTEITLPPEVEDDLYVRTKRGLIRPTYTVISDDKKKLHLIYTNEKGYTDPDKTRTVNVDTDLVSSLGKNYGGTGWTKKYLFSKKPESPSSTKEDKPLEAPKPKEEKNTVKGKLDLSKFDKSNKNNARN